jgi:hypothetical protein
VFIEGKCLGAAMAKEQERRVGLNREKLFPDKAQRELQDAADAVRDAAESLMYATRKGTIDKHRTWDLLFELDAKRNVLHDVLVHSFPALDEPL